MEKQLKNKLGIQSCGKKIYATYFKQHNS